MKDLIFYKKTDNKKFVNIGNYNSDDRFYSYLNKEIEDNLTKSNKFIKLIINYLFSSSNYKHDPYLKKRFSIGTLFFDLFCILCLIGFVICLFTGVLSPLISYFKAPESDKKLVLTAANWVLTGLAVLFMIISILYLILVFKFRNVNKGLQLGVYVQQKLNMILNLKNFFKIKNLVSNKKKHHKKTNDEIYLFDNGQNSSMNTIWLSIQIFNLMGYLFDDLNIAICLRNMSDIEVKSWNEIVQYDFDQISMDIVDSEYDNLPISSVSYASATYYGLQISKSSIWSYIITVLFAGIFGSAITNIF